MMMTKHDEALRRIREAGTSLYLDDLDLTEVPAPKEIGQLSRLRTLNLFS